MKRKTSRELISKKFRPSIMVAVLLVLLSIMAIKPVYADQFMPVNSCQSMDAGWQRALMAE